MNMKNVFLVFGYGIPKNILKDMGYIFYLNMIFNRIYDVVTKKNGKKNEKALIVFCGGKTDMFLPYHRNEADEMIKLFTVLIKKRPYVKSLAKQWLLVPEKNSLSTLENILNGKKIIHARQIKKAGLFIFCEQTRGKRVKALAKKIFGAAHHVRVVPIDFDVSPNRYLTPEFLARKERAELKHSLWALQSAENLKKHHELCIEKIAYLRKAGPKAHGDAVKQWWDKNEQTKNRKPSKL